MGQTRPIEEFQMNSPDLGSLKRQHPGLEDKLYGAFAKDPNIYELDEGTVVSWNLEQGKPKNPTIGMIPPGSYQFPTEYTEIVTVLEGILVTSVDGNEQMLQKGDSRTIPPEKTLGLEVEEKEVVYFCEYQ